MTQIILKFVNKKSDNKNKLSIIDEVLNCQMGLINSYLLGKHWVVLAFLATFILSQSINAQVSGTVFRDFNSNGTKDNSATFNEPFLAGITVKAYDSSGSEVGSTLSNTVGFYEFIGLTLPLRIEFSGYQAEDYTAPAGGSNNTSVQFYTAPSSTADFGVNYPDDYVGSTNPTVAAAVFRNGNPLGGGTSANEYSLLSFLYNDVTDQTTPVPPSIQSNAGTIQVGSIFGLAFNREKKKLFSTAFLKRHVGWGPLGVGGIYVTDYSSGSGVTSALVDLTTLGVTLATAGAPSSLLTNAGRGLPANLGTASHDPVAFDYIGSYGMGDVDISQDGNTLYIVNLAQQNIIVVDIADYIATNAPITAANISTITPALPTCSNGVARPFALKVYRNVLYLGTTCSGENGGSIADVNISVQALDLNTNAWTTVLDAVSMDYVKGAATNENSTAPVCTTWNPWTNDDSQYTVDGIWGTSVKYIYPACRPSPILSDIEFDGNGDMILGILDRSGHQWGFINYRKVIETYFIDWRIGGDVLKASKCSINATTWTLENDGGLCGVAGSVLQQNAEGPGGGEFFYGDYGYEWGGNAGDMAETSNGTLASWAGSNQVLLTATDPSILFTGGVLFLNNVSGATDKRAELYRDNVSTDAGSNPIGTLEGAFGKSNGMGDIELLSEPAPLEIGNRIWTDTDSDGIQDANEMGIDGITLELYEGTTLVGTVVTANGGQWYFNNSNVNLNGATELKPHTAYTIRVLSSEFPSGYSVTNLNSDGSTNGDLRDSDATLVGGNAEIAYTTGSYGQNDHTLDIGLRAAATPDLSLVKTVNTAIATLNSQVTFTLTLTNDNSIDATGVVVTDQLPAGVTFVSSSDPANVSVSGSTITWNVGTFLGTDAPKTLNITVTAGNEGVFINNAEIAAMTETDGDSTPNNNAAGEDDQDQACFSIPVSLCSDSPTATITITANTATSYQWYVSTDNGASYTALSGETSQTLLIDNTLMGGNGITKYFKVAYNGAGINDGCGGVMCCPVIVTTQTCTVCPAPKCIPIAVSKLNP